MIWVILSLGGALAVMVVLYAYAAEHELGRSQEEDDGD